MHVLPSVCCVLGDVHSTDLTSMLAGPYSMHVASRYVCVCVCVCVRVCARAVNS